MSDNNEQNGCQLLTVKAEPPTPDSQMICRDFVWGVCPMNEHCKYRHELEYESMRSILKFCHDYQNRVGCMRLDCSYLHVSRDEEKLFMTSGVIPRVLAERYAWMAAPNDSGPVPVQQMIYMKKFLSKPPPPLPPLPLRPPLPPLPLRPPLPPSVQDSPPAPFAPSPALRPQIKPQMNSPMGPGIAQMPMYNVMPPSTPNPRPLEQPSHSQVPLTVKNNLHEVMPSMPVPISALMASLLTPPPPPPPTTATAPTQMAPPAYTVPQTVQHLAPNIHITIQYSGPL